MNVTLGEIRIARTEDAQWIRSVMVHPKIWPHISDDGCPPWQEFEPVVGPGVWYVEALLANVGGRGGRSMGFWVLHPQNTATWECHTCLLPWAWGPLAVEAGKSAAEWVWANTPARRIVTQVPVENRLAYAFARRIGMEQYGVNPKAWLKNGQLQDVALLGMSKPETAEEGK